VSVFFVWLAGKQETVGRGSRLWQNWRCARCHQNYRRVSLSSFNGPCGL